MNRNKKPLYRKDNKRLRMGGAHINTGGEYRYKRNTKEFKNSEAQREGMRVRNLGVDYTPLFRFLLSKVGQVWSEVHSEAVSRLDKSEPIYWMVREDKSKIDDCGFFRVSENTMWQELYVDADGILQKAPLPEYPKVSCACCTHTFNGNILPNNKPEHYYNPDYVTFYTSSLNVKERRRKTKLNKKVMAARQYNFKRKDEDNLGK